MPPKSSIPTPSLPLQTHHNADAGAPQRPPHPLLLKAVDSQIHILAKAWIHYAQSLPLRPELGAGELYSQMDARIQLFAVITYEFNRLIAEFALEYGKEHKCLKETTTKDITAYVKCTETDVAKLCTLWNDYSQAFEEKFKHARREQLPKQEANLMKEELSRLLYISKAMEKVWLSTDQAAGKAACSEKNEGIKKWIADTASHLTHRETRTGLDKQLMQKVLDENKNTAAKFVSALRERLERRKDAILNNNYVETEECERIVSHCKKTGTEMESGKSQPSSLVDSVWGDGENKHQSESSYDEFDINDMRYLTPMLFPRPATPMALLPAKPNRIQAPNTVTYYPPPDYPPPPPPDASDVKRAVESHTVLIQHPPASKSENITPAYPGSAYSGSTSSSILRTLPIEHPGFSFRALFSSRSRATPKEIPSESKPPEKTNDAPKPPLSPRQFNPLPPPPHFQTLRKPHSIAHLRSAAAQPLHLEQPPEIPQRNPEREYERKPVSNMSPDVIRRRSLSASLCESPPGTRGGDQINGAMLVPKLIPLLRSKGSTIFNGEIVKEVPKGEEDPFLEQHAYQGEPF